MKDFKDEIIYNIYIINIINKIINAITLKIII